MDAVCAYVGLDVHKDTISVAIADAVRNGEVGSWGTISNAGEDLVTLARQLTAKHKQLEFVYEAGPCGYDVHRRSTTAGHVCIVVAPSRIPRKPGDRVKNDHRDAVTLARLARAGDLTAIWVPDAVHEAMRDVVRARHAAIKDLKIARQRIQSFLLKYRAMYPGKAWSGRHLTWLANRQFEHRAQQIAFQGYLNALNPRRRQPGGDAGQDRRAVRFGPVRRAPPHVRPGRQVAGGFLSDPDPRLKHIADMFAIGRKVFPGYMM